MVSKLTFIIKLGSSSQDLKHQTQPKSYCLNFEPELHINLYEKGWDQLCKLVILV